MNTPTSAAILAAASLFVLATPAHAQRCRDVFSKIQQQDERAPFVVGDSVTVPAGEFLGERGFAVNAVACRTFAQGLQVMSERRRPDVVVMALGSNGAVSAGELDRALELVGPSARLMLVLPKELGGARDPDGRTMRAFERAHPGQVTTIDWPAYSADHSDWFAVDGLHVTPAGARAFATMIAEAVEFVPPEQADPPSRPKPQPQPKPTPGRAERLPDPALVTMWSALAETLEAVVAPPLRLLGRLVADRAQLGPSDL